MTWAILTIILLVSMGAIWLLQLGKRETYLPPGPPTLPLIGNLHIFPGKYPHLKFTEWARQYGGIFSLKIGSQTIIVLNTMEHAKGLLDKRNATTANRPRNHVFGMVGKEHAFAYTAANSAWRAQRKIANTVLAPTALPAHAPLQYAETCQTLYDILHTPEAGSNSVMPLHASDIPMDTYRAFTTTSVGTPSHSRHRLYTESVVRISSPAIFSRHVPPVDKLPILGYIPERWAPWKTLVKDAKEKQRELYFGLLEECKGHIANNEGNGCLVEDLLGRVDEHGMDPESIGTFASILLEAGADTTSSLLKSLVLLLVESPEVQRKAYGEIHRVVGTQRAPILADYKDLPYVNAVIKEVLRLRPVVPLALPHETSATEEYLDYIIPENTTIFANVYGINHDPEYFDDPESFRPERYLLTEHGTKPGVDDRPFRADIGFGFGRRACPGIHLAKDSVALVTMNLIWAFEFKPLLDPKTGNEVGVDPFDYEEGIVFAPKSFQCRISPRNKHVIDIIELQYREAADTLSKFERGIIPEEKVSWKDH
ncbi:hypothetical protein VNI00_010031 [Paramarasmius palmivorus]|uniref:Cytochrome P450 n=1 Tax=Paramarasmius palmivorus TaxID=297713 RepID=A0AAW0CNA3_9AGAR